MTTATKTQITQEDNDLIEKFNEIINSLTNPILETVLDQQSVTRDKVVAQLLMNLFDTDELLNPEERQMALNMAHHMGPDWAQQVYRFSVLLVKLA